MQKGVKYWRNPLNKDNNRRHTPLTPSLSCPIKWPWSHRCATLMGFVTNCLTCRNNTHRHNSIAWGLKHTQTHTNIHTDTHKLPLLWVVFLAEICWIDRCSDFAEVRCNESITHASASGTSQGHRLCCPPLMSYQPPYPRQHDCERLARFSKTDWEIYTHGSVWILDWLWLQTLPINIKKTYLTTFFTAHHSSFLRPYWPRVKECKAENIRNRSEAISPEQRRKKLAPCIVSRTAPSHHQTPINQHKRQLSMKGMPSISHLYSFIHTFLFSLHRPTHLGDSVGELRTWENT